MDQKPHLIIVNNFHSDTVARLDALYNTHHLWKIGAQERNALLEELDGKCSVAATASWTCDPAIYNLRSLELIACFGVGVDGIDFQKAKTLNAKISNTPDVLNDAVADLAIGMLIAITRNLVRADDYVRSGQWAEKGPLPFGDGIQGKRLGVLGMGRIGEAIARRAEPFGLAINYHNRWPKNSPYTYFDTPKQLATESDILICVLPGGHETQHIVNLELLTALGPEGYFINVGRGSSVNENDLATALTEGLIAGAALDVYAKEPLTNTSLVEQKNLLLLPHIGSATQQTRKAMGELVISNIAAHLDQKALISEYEYL